MSTYDISKNSREEIADKYLKDENFKRELDIQLFLHDRDCFNFSQMEGFKEHLDRGTFCQKINFSVEHFCSTIKINNKDPRFLDIMFQNCIP